MAILSQRSHSSIKLTWAWSKYLILTSLSNLEHSRCCIIFLESNISERCSSYVSFVSCIFQLCDPDSKIAIIYGFSNNFKLPILLAFGNICFLLFFWVLKGFFSQGFVISFLLEEKKKVLLKTQKDGQKLQLLLNDFRMGKHLVPVLIQINSGA